MKVCSMLLAAVSAPGGPGVMTNTLCANAQYMPGEHHGRGELAQCASLEQQGQIVTTPTIASVMEKIQSAFQKSRIDRATARPPPGRAGVEHWDGAL